MLGGLGCGELGCEGFGAGGEQLSSCGALWIVFLTDSAA